ncbi:2-dehydropantoate 2-reductase [Porticoccaceae bacterium]|nr:2-dehydropantoate 2-reductase [Porticoccaceae bacterium]MDA7768489.1 2-dehydropantoate 2-reductase [Porticoccaceae bacterium]MDA8598812.1 2-dehydropantoate 2-reductase [Porticoccaceae bacterium]MDA9583023.1 2-dehydropantoate 2-reductase [Porticoccaceae bacterium]MDB2395984.1 2-dehydropantoate 2-reductase [Porticoccaceae bacterium]|tara:strand:- start:1734 stop:2708 length:975 start_codon:yes stop_codon:yes gene_type:complete
MQLAIYGAGSTGCYLGGLMQLCGHKVSLICRARIRDSIMNAGGITLTDYTGQNEKVVPSALITRLTDETFDAVFVTLKCHQLEAAVDDLKQLAEDGAQLLFMQNGLDSLDAILNELPSHAVKQGVIPFNILSQDNAHFHRGTEGILLFHQTSVTQQLAKQLGAIGFPCELHKDMKPVIYGKLLLNLNNALNALANQPIKTQLENRKLRKVYAAAQREWLEVANMEGVELAQFTAVRPSWMPAILSLPNWIFLRLAKAMLDIDPHARSSMWEDIKLGRKTEVAFLNGAIVKRAEKLGIDVPINKKITALIHKIEKGETVSLTLLY